MAAPRLALLTPHEAFYLIKSCFAVPKVLFLLRSAPAFRAMSLADFNRTTRDVLTTILNISLTDDGWSQAFLPVRWGGLGIRDVKVLAPSAYLSSRHSTISLVGAILPPYCSHMGDQAILAALEAWQRLAIGACPPQGEEAIRQRAWDGSICSAIYENIFSRADQSSQARLRAVASPDAGAWLHCLPVRNLGLSLNERELRIAAGLRLGASLVQPHSCHACEKEVDVTGHHGLSCKSSAGRQRRHALANEVLVRAIRAAGFLAVLEPGNLCRDDGKKRPDGATREAWSRGRDLVWDFTCPDTLAASYVAQSALNAGWAACRAEQNKRAKYARIEASDSFIFAPVAIETLGTWGASARDLCREIGAKIADKTRDPRSHFFLVQRLSLAVQRGNVVSVIGTFPPEDDSSSWFGD